MLYRDVCHSNPIRTLLKIGRLYKCFLVGPVDRILGGIVWNVNGKVVLFIASSLDGYIATEEHNLDWLLTVEGEGDNGYSRFYDTVDTELFYGVTF